VAATEGAKIHHHFLVYRSKDSACTTLPLRSQPGSVMAGGQHLFLSFLSSVYNLAYLTDRNKTVVCLNFTYTLKIDKMYAKMTSDRIPQEYSSG